MQTRGVPRRDQQVIPDFVYKYYINTFLYVIFMFSLIIARKQLIRNNSHLLSNVMACSIGVYTDNIFWTDQSLMKVSYKVKVQSSLRTCLINYDIDLSLVVANINK